VVCSWSHHSVLTLRRERLPPFLSPQNGWLLSCTLEKIHRRIAIAKNFAAGYVHGMRQRRNFHAVRGFLGGCALMGIMLSSVFGEEVLVRWDTMDLGMLGVRWAESNDARWVGTTYIASARNSDAEVLGADSEKAIAFGGIPILRVGTDPTGSSGFALRGRPFSPPSKKGGLEFQFAIESGKVHLTLGQNPTVFEERNDQAVLLRSKDAILSVALEANGAVHIGKDDYQSQSMDFLEAGHPYKLQILWDFENADPHFTALLNGEPLVKKINGDALFIKVTPEEAERGIDSFVVAGEKSGESIYYVGNILSVDP